MDNDWEYNWDDENDWQAAQQSAEEQRRTQVAECWQRIKSGEYTDRDICIIEYELRGIL